MSDPSAGIAMASTPKRGRGRPRKDGRIIPWKPPAPRKPRQHISPPSTQQENPSDNEEAPVPRGANGRPLRRVAVKAMENLQKMSHAEDDAPHRRSPENNDGSFNGDQQSDDASAFDDYTGSQSPSASESESFAESSSASEDYATKKTHKSHRGGPDREKSAALCLYAPEPRFLGTSGSSRRTIVYKSKYPDQVGRDYFACQFSFYPSLSLCQDMSWIPGKNSSQSTTAWGVFSVLDRLFPQFLEHPFDVPPDLFPSRAVSLGSDVDRQEKAYFSPFASFPLSSYIPHKPGWIADTGGTRIASVAWAPLQDASYFNAYLAVGTCALNKVPFYDSDPLTFPSTSIQIWHLNASENDLSPTVDDTKPRGTGLHVAFTILHDLGDALQLKWCPGGSKSFNPLIESLGILAAVFTSGKIALFLVPRPPNELKKLETKPLCVLDAAPHQYQQVSWLSHTRFSSVDNSGALRIWDISSLYENPSSSFSPTLVASNTSQTFLRDVVSVPVPPASHTRNKSFFPSELPPLLATSSVDGTYALLDTRRLSSGMCTLLKERSIGSPLDYSPPTGRLVLSGQDNIVRLLSLSHDSFTRTHLCYPHKASVLALSASHNHPFVASASADGSLVIFNAMRFIRRSRNTQYASPIYVNQASPSLSRRRCIDNIVPLDVNMSNEDPARAKKGGKRNGQSMDSDEPRYLNVFPPSVAVTACQWHPNLEWACCLASGSADGTLRVDWVQLD